MEMYHVKQFIGVGDGLQVAGGIGGKEEGRKAVPASNANTTQVTAGRAQCFKQRRERER